MKQIAVFCKNNHIYSTITLTIKERVKLLFKGTLEISIDQNVQSSTGRVESYYRPKIFKKQ